MKAQSNSHPPASSRPLPWAVGCAQENEIKSSLTCLNVGSGRCPREIIQIPTGSSLVGALLRGNNLNMSQSKKEGWESSEDLRRQLGLLKSECLLQSTLTGIKIKKYSKKIEDLINTEKAKESTKKVLQRYRLSGNCHVITFHLEFQVLEIQNHKELSSVITDLNIIMEPKEYPELNEFVSRVEERRDLFMFFKSLHFFVEWCEYRKHTFTHFKEKYPDVVYLSEGAACNCMRIQSTRQPEFELIIVWRIQVDDKGKVLPKLDLLTKIPQQARKRDKKEVQKRAPVCFRTLLGVLGIEASLESLIKLFLSTKE
ncbi:PREDICTED: centromere protein P [Elephantulus edwardii]|uniref:centromere protein P n=1 Tax=Elephantulus edwardii TaxID=28737 RepID=UPI0003F0F0EA|nr:PREDICTED: centromere protein P [Elephantulus edwardii]